MWSHIKRHQVGKKLVPGPDEFKKLVIAALHRPQKLPHVIRGFFRKLNSPTLLTPLPPVFYDRLRNLSTQPGQLQGTIRDGSAKRLAKGYWMVSVVGAEAGKRRMIPIGGKVLSQESPEFISEDDQLPRAVRKISDVKEGCDIWVVDRGGDRGRLFQELLGEERQRHRFIVRLRGDRHLLRRGFAPMAVMDLARHVATGHRRRLVREGGGGSTSFDLCFGAFSVRSPQHPEIPLWLVVVRGTGKTPLLLLPNVPTSSSEGSLWRIVSSYLPRGSIEVMFRFSKQAYGFENIRVLTFNRIRNLVCLLILAVYYVEVCVSGPPRLQLAVLRLVEQGKPMFGMPAMALYLLAGDLATPLSHHPSSPRRRRAPPATQLPLFETPQHFPGGFRPHFALTRQPGEVIVGLEYIA